VRHANPAHRWLSLLALLLVAAAPPPAAPPPRVLDSMDSLAGWTKVASDGLTADLSSVPGATGRAIRLAVDYRGRSGYAVATRALPLTLDGNFELRFKLRGSGPPNQLQVKLVDSTGENVWWWVRPAKPFPTGFETVRIKRRQIDFAWGPTRDKTLKQTARIEFVLNAAQGGRADFTIDDLTLTPLPPDDAPFPAPIVTASSGRDPRAAIDADPATAWHSATARNEQLTIDFGRPREFGAVFLRWAPGAQASQYAIDLSPDGRAWTTARSVVAGDGGRDPLLMTESEARFVRVRMIAGPGRDFALADIAIEPLATGADPNAFIAAVAKDNPRGAFPRGFSEQPYWTLVGVDGGSDSALAGEDGAVEIGRGSPSIEPFVIDRGQLAGWASVTPMQSLRDSYLPIPTVTWISPGWRLATTSIAAGDVKAAQLVTRYALTNTGPDRRVLTLMLALRPFQVNGPRQFLNTTGGTSAIAALAWDGATVRANGRTAVTPSRAPDALALSPFDGGITPDRLLAQALPPSLRSMTDPAALASGALLYRFDLAPGETGRVSFSAPLFGTPAPIAAEAAEATTAAQWHAKLDRFGIDTPAAGKPVVDTMRTALAHILMSRDGPALHPATRSYARSWIRDGAMMAESLLRLGHGPVAADYLRWYAQYAYDNGKVPCCVDKRGSDPTPENDSHGEFAFLAGEVWRYGRDEALARAIWPRVDAALAYQEAQRQTERTAANLIPSRRALYGLMPPSISHEGYSDKPAYSYWDDFWALEGFRSGAALAADLGKQDAATKWRGREAEFRADIAASVIAANAKFAIDFVPGAADRGDFDATSTTVGLAPGDGATAIDPRIVRNTFERQWRNFVTRRDDGQPWVDYTPYELRNIGAFVRLGWRDRAAQLLDFYLADRRPVAWNGWAEVVGRLPRETRFIGDMPHAWISSDYIRSALDLFYYERRSDRALVLAAGIAPSWLTGAGVAIRDVRTPYGLLSYALRPSGRALRLTLAGSARPPGGFVLAWPFADPAPRWARIDGRRVRLSGGEVLIPAAARSVVLSRP
jgi:F5/8 type C domain